MADNSERSQALVPSNPVSQQVERLRARRDVDEIERLTRERDQARNDLDFYAARELREERDRLRTFLRESKNLWLGPTPEAVSWARRRDEMLSDEPDSVPERQLSASEAASISEAFARSPRRISDETPSSAPASNPHDAMQGIVNELRARLIAVPKPGTKPFRPTYPIAMCVGSAPHKPGDDAGLMQLPAGLFTHSDACLVQEHVFAVEPLCERAAALIEHLAGLSSETKAIRSPDGYAYRYPDGTGGVIRFNSGQEVNGYEPMEALPYWLGPAPPTQFPKQPKDCRHDLAMLKCSECGIDFSKVRVSSSPEKACEEPTEAEKRAMGVNLDSRDHEAR